MVEKLEDRCRMLIENREYEKTKKGKGRRKESAKAKEA